MIVVIVGDSLGGVGRNAQRFRHKRLSEESHGLRNGQNVGHRSPRNGGTTIVFRPTPASLNSPGRPGTLVGLVRPKVVTQRWQDFRAMDVGFRWALPNLHVVKIIGVGDGIEK